MSEQRIIPARNWGQWVIAILLIAIVGFLLAMVIMSRHITWSAIPQYLFDETILEGIKLTILFTVLSMLISIVAGGVLAMMRLSPNAIVSGFASLYIWFFRGTPLLVQIIFWFNIQLFIPSIDIGSIHFDTNSIITAFVAALLALSLNEAAYMAEIMRGGLMAVDSGQQEAAKALGYTPTQAMLRIIFPQALRVIIPPIGNQTISMLKTTSLVSVVAAQDLLTRAQNIYAQELPHHRAADRCQHLVPRDDDGRFELAIRDRTPAWPVYQRRTHGLACCPAPASCRREQRMTQQPEFTSSGAMVEALDVRKSFGAHEVLKGINLTIRKGEVVCLLGPSGSGKSTFLRCINHLERMSGGRILVDGHLIGYNERHGLLYEMSGKELARQRQDIGMVFQRFNLFAHHDVLDQHHRRHRC